jgi:autotransporter-associated beta strand protein
MSNGATLKILTEKEATSRGLTLGAGGGKIDVPSELTWSGRIVGTSLVKQDSGLLIINANNSELAQSIINGGIVRLGTENAEIYGMGKKVTLNAGSIEFLNNVSSYSKSNFDIEIPAGATGKLVLDGRCDYYGTLTGSGTLNLVTDYVRGTHFGNWSAFEGQINLTANSANSKYGDDFRVNNTYGYPASSINLGDKVAAYYSAAVTAGTTINIGELSGISTSSLAGGPTATVPFTWRIGAKSTDAIFNGVIKEQTATSVTAITKVGSGSWTLTNANTYKGETTAKAGTLVVKNTTGSATGTGVVNVDSTGTLTGNGIIAGALNIKNGGTLAPGIAEADSLAMDTLTILSAVTFSPNSILNIDINGTTSGADLLKTSGAVTLNGELNLTNLGEPVIAGDSFKIVNASAISGSFNSISPVEPSATTRWDFKTFNNDGILRVADYLPQTITLNFTDKTYGNADFSAEGIASSGLPLTYSIDNPSVATVSADGMIHIVGAGTCTVTASQAGSDNYRPAVASKSLTVAKANLVINFALIAPKTYGDEPSALKISSNGNETPIVINSMNSNVASVSDSTLTINGAGFTILTASQAGNSNYNEATKVYRILFVKKAMITATAADTSRNINRPNPEFRITYSGFVGNDDVYSLNWLPFASCNAKKNSPAGTYEIKVSGGYDDNYYFNYVSGILTVIDSSKGSPFAADVRLYPNPTQDLVNIDLRKNMDNITVEVYTSTGRKVTSVKKSGNLLSLDLGGYPNGLYTIRLISGKNVVCKPVLKN